ncbi:MAG: hypothetical protein ACI82F_001714, partial [Planctomycetota bacterium]
MDTPAATLLGGSPPDLEPPIRSSPPKKNIEMAKRKKKSEMPGISDAELLVLKELWNSGPAGPSGLRA